MLVSVCITAEIKWGGVWLIQSSSLKAGCHSLVIIDRTSISWSVRLLNKRQHCLFCHPKLKWHRCPRRRGKENYFTKITLCPVQSALPLCLMLLSLCHKHSTHFISSWITWIEPYLLKANHGLVTIRVTLAPSLISFFYILDSSSGLSQSIWRCKQRRRHWESNIEAINVIQKILEKDLTCFFQSYIRLTFHLEMQSEQCTRP